MNKCLQLGRFLKLGVPAVAIALTASLYSASAHAQGSSPVTVHQNVNFSGRELSVGAGDVSIQDLRNTVGNDVISSIEIAPGYTVLACQNSRLRGRCETFTSDVSDLRTIGFNDTISALRISSGSLPAVSVFQNVGFAGRVLDIQGEGDISIQDLRNSVGNDAISSIRINEGYEVFACRNSGFRGTCETFTSTISDVRRLNSSFNDVISSLRVTRVSNDPAVVTVFQNVRFAGRSLDIQGEGVITIDDLRNSVGNDAISSIRIADGYEVIACQHASNGGSGRCEAFISDVSDLRSIGFNDTISFLSVARISDTPVPVPNTPPVAADLVLSVDADDTVSFTFADLRALSDDDAGRDALDIVVAATGSLSQSLSVLTYNPAPEFGTLPVGEEREVSFSYTVTDEEGLTATGNIIITVTGTFVAPPPNSLPVASDFSLTTDADTAIDIDVFDLGNVSDADAGDTLTISVLQNVDGLVENSNGNFTYNPAAFSDLPRGQSGGVSFEYEVSDGTDTVRAMITITVDGTFVENTPPVANDLSVTVDFTPLTVVDLRSSVSDADGDELFYSISPADDFPEEALRGVFFYNPPQQFSTLLPGESATETFEYTVTDGTASATAMLTITINGNIPPEAFGLQLVTPADVAVDFDFEQLVDASTDQNGDALNISVTPEGNAFDENGDALENVLPVLNVDDPLFTYDPAPDFGDLPVGELVRVVFPYTVTDPVGASDTGEIVITVQGVVAAVPTFVIGEAGPTGGTVFSISNGGRSGLEFAAEVLGPVEWGCQQELDGVGNVGDDGLPVYSDIGIPNVPGIFVGGVETVVQTGLLNRFPLLNASATANSTDFTNCFTEAAAAEVADNFISDVDGFPGLGGFYMPSISELLDIRRALANPTVLDPDGNSVGLETIPLWSSTEQTNQNVWFLQVPGNLPLADQPSPANKGLEFYVLPIRSF